MKTVLLATLVLSLTACEAGADTTMPKEMENTFRPIAMKCLASTLISYERGNGDLPMSSELCPLGARAFIDVPAHGRAMTVMRAGDQVGVITEGGDLLWVMSPETAEAE